MDNVKEVTSPSTTKNDLKPKDYVRREDGKKDKNSGKKFREEFERVNKERRCQDGNWFEDNYDTTNTDERATQEYNESNRNVGVVARNVFLSKIKVNNEIRVLQEDKKAKEEKKLGLKRNAGDAR